MMTLTIKLMKKLCFVMRTLFHHLQLKEKEKKEREKER